MLFYGYRRPNVLVRAVGGCRYGTNQRLISYKVRYSDANQLVDGIATIQISHQQIADKHKS